MSSREGPVAGSEATAEAPVIQVSFRGRGNLLMYRGFRVSAENFPIVQGKGPAPAQEEQKGEGSRWGLVWSESPVTATGNL